jgi:hypothetical protein
MRKLMMLAAMVAMVLVVVAVPAMADTVLSSDASLIQANDGNQIAVNDADQDLNQDQRQHNPGGEGGDGGDGGDATLIDEDENATPLTFCEANPTFPLCQIVMV